MESFPDLADQIFGNLDVPSLMKSKKAFPTCSSFINSSRNIWKTVILNNVHREYYGDWRRSLQNLDAHQLQTVAIFFHENSLDCSEEIKESPVLFAIQINDAGIFTSVWNTVSLGKLVLDGLWEFLGCLIKVRDDYDCFKTFMEYIVINFGKAGFIKSYSFCIKDAIFHSRFDIISSLSTIFKRNSKFLSPNEHPLLISTELENLEVFKEFCEIFEDINPTNSVGTTPLHLTAQSGNFEFFKFIFEQTADAGADVNPVNFDDNFTPIQYAALSGDYNICQLVLESGHFEENQPLISPLHLAIQSGNTDLCDLFLEHLENTDPVDSVGFNTLHYAAMTDSFELFKKLLDCGADLNAISLNKKSVLHCAAIGQSAEIFKFVWDHMRVNGENPCLPDDSGISPVEYAIIQKNETVLEVYYEFFHQNDVSSYSTSYIPAYLQNNEENNEE